MLIRAADATHVLTEIDLSLPDRRVEAIGGRDRRRPRAYRHARSRILCRRPLCPVGKTPLYLGQPVAMLIFEDFDTFDQARLALRDQLF